jgi:hypothetical protein
MKLLKLFAKKTHDGNMKFAVNDSSSWDDDLDQEYLFDFRQVYGHTNTSVIRDYGNTINYSDDDDVEPNDSSFVSQGSLVVNGTTSIKVGPKNVKVKNAVVITPRQVLDQLEKEPRRLDLIGLDEKISIMKDKVDILKQKYAKRECSAMVERLENRKKYMSHRAFFDQFQTTTDDRIKAFNDKYGFDIKQSDLFVPELPDEAIKTMKMYTEHVKQICDKKPIFYIIANPGDFKRREERRDPILLAQSPFGFYWDILGAWDREMLLLSEL